MKIPRGTSISNSCICEGEKLRTEFEIENKAHEKFLCENCINLIRSFSSMEIIYSEVLTQ